MHLLVIRFSAIGDVALSVPVLQACRQQHPGIKISVLSREKFRSLYEPLDVNFIAADLHGKHKGVNGLYRLYRQIKREIDPTAVADFHGVLRTHILGSFFKLAGIPVVQIDKGRSEKKALTRRARKIRKPLRHTTLRYADVLEKAGTPTDFDPSQHPVPEFESQEASKLWQKLNLKNTVVGMAPAAAFPGKSWPMGKVQQLLQQLSAHNISVVLFGGPDDREILQKLSKDKDDIINIAGQLEFGDEIAFMRKLDLMISMDSSNMHLATLAGIPVVSIWGATHRHAGFGPLGNNDELIAEVPVETLSCRPCSVFGNRPCFRKDYACLNWLEADDVFKKVHRALQK